MTKKITYLEHGGRVIGLYPKQGINVFWNNPVPQSGQSWPNPGGDRVWLSPEAELFFPERQAGWASYTVPTVVDPGNWHLKEDRDGSAEFREQGRGRFFGTGENWEFELCQRIIPLEAPGIELPPGIMFAGYRKEIALTVRGCFRHGIRPAAWNLLQVPPGGVIMVPPAAPITYSGQPSWENNADVMPFCIPARNGSFKIGIVAEESSGKMVYFRGAGTDSCLVVRRFSVPSICFDTPFPVGIACPQQIYVDDGELGGFGEMEYHTEAVPEDGGSIHDCCFTEAFVGGEEICKELAVSIFREGVFIL